ncbi:PR domain zinc finger protein 15 [Taenia solium]|eukprot:TsM_000304000 transcript=TsM_000304000 gene=TsM_000304000
MDLIQALFRREVFGTRLPIFPSLRPICLWDILPMALCDEVFLGFSADGRFLVSYVFRSNAFRLAFWLVPGDEGSPNSWLSKPFAVFSTSMSTNQIHDQVGVRFLQSTSDTQLFVLIYSLGIDSISIVWGTMPEPNCTDCRQACDLIGTSTYFNCPKHFQFLTLSPDCSFFGRECVSGWSAEVADGSPNCVYNDQVCSCMGDLTASVHPSVCPETGRLRVTWVSQGRQVRLLSYHGKRARGGLSYPPPLAHQGSFLTNNYCSSCFLWSNDVGRCRFSPESPQFSSSDRPNYGWDESHGAGKRCALATLPVRVVKWTEPWPEGHRHPLVANNITCAINSTVNYMLIDFLALSLEALVPQCSKNNLGSLFASANLSPDKLLANRLCGQCHSYFDTQKWRPYDQAKDSSSDIPIIAHMEEVVFDIPDYTEGLTDRILFASPLEPNWILVYDIDRSKARARHSLTALIDASTGRQMDPDEARCTNRLQVVQSRCPAWLRFSGCVPPRCFSMSTCATASPLPRVSFPYASHSQAATAGVGSTLVASLSYNRYPVCHWRELAEVVRGIISTRVLQAPLPLYILLTSGDEGPWRRLHSIPRPQMVYASANGVEVAIDSITRLSYKSPATVDVLISVDFQQEASWKPFLWKCGLCVAQFTVVEQSSVELIAAHLRLHAELRCCDKCSTILPNSPLAVDAPDAQQHRCSSLIVLVLLKPPHRILPTIPLFVCAPLRQMHQTRRGNDSPCSLGFSSAAQYQQHLKNVHNKYRFVCPECRKSPESLLKSLIKRALLLYRDCIHSLGVQYFFTQLQNGTTFSTKGNMTTHFQRVHNQSDSVTCPICSKRISNHFNLDRHIRLVHQTIGRWSQEETTPTVSGGCIVVTSSGDGDGTAPEREQGSSIGPEHGYLLCMAPSSPPLQHRRHLDEGGAHSPTSLVVADISVEPPLRRPKKASNTDTNANMIHKHWERE